MKMSSVLFSCVFGVTFAVATALGATEALGKPDRPDRDGHPKVIVSVIGYGDVSLLSPPECASEGRPCVQEVRGSFLSDHGNGTLRSDFTVFWSRSTSNNQDGFCAPYSQRLTLSAQRGELVFLGSGTLCEIGASATGVPETVYGRLQLISASGAFEGMDGVGNLSGAGWSGKSRHFSTLVLWQRGHSPKDPLALHE